MDLASARLLLGLRPPYAEQQVMTAFRSAARHAHPDLGGNHDELCALIEARGVALDGLSRPSCVRVVDDAGLLSRLTRRLMDLVRPRPVRVR